MAQYGPPYAPSLHLELAVVVYAPKTWRDFLLGKRCEIYTDYKSLKYIFIRRS